MKYEYLHMTLKLTLCEIQEKLFLVSEYAFWAVVFVFGAPECVLDM